MRTLLLTSVAVTALLTGTALAPAQTRQDQQSQQPPAATQQSSPQSRAHEQKSPRDQSSQNDSSRMGGNAKSNDKAAGSDRGTTGASSGDNKPNAAENAQPKDSKKNPDAMRSDRREGAKSGRSSDRSGMKNETTGNAQQNAPAADRNANGAKSRQKNDRATSGQSPSNTRGNANSANPNASSGTSGQPNSQTSGQGGSQTGNQTGSQQTQTNGRSGTGGSTASVEQQTKFNSVIEKQRIQPVTNANFSVSVGTSIPASVHVHDVPRDIVTIYPEYRGKKFVVVRDEIVIIEPKTRKIVSVIPRSGRSTTGATTSTTTSSKLNLTPEKRRTIHETVIKEQSAPRCSDVQVTVGSTVSPSLQLSPLPSLVLQDVPEIRSYQYCVKDNDVVLVDPGEHRIIGVID